MESEQRTYIEELR